MIDIQSSLEGKKQLETLLSGNVPAFPPHFELQFQLDKICFGISWDELVEQIEGQSPQKRQQAIIDYHRELYVQVMERFHWAAVPAPGGGEVDYAKGLEEMKKAVGERALVFSFSPDGVFWMPTGSEMMDFVVRLFEHPEQLHKEAREKCDKAKQLAKIQKESGADFIVQNTDFGFNSGPFISPKHFAEFCTPYMAEIIEYMHNIGLKVILHSDGNLNDILDQIASTKVDGYQSIDPQGSMDIKEVRNQYPEWLLMGNVACNMLQDVNDESIRESVRYCMRHGGFGKRYIFSTSNCIFKSMPLESYKIMLDEYYNICGKKMLL
ncbi:uroporphyrinogen decarboxylase family protein [Sedimentisphaera salicampi]|uniref:uroporphyrinogen decarboxylase family protein n=1 Tax=Sedimentisphaera salicampi TaxID=1941349 RepID=UPI000B9BC997|nr:uroporphyrinogen decarboxylase family protein [Sedimentisphaera salicampi]OXU14903.1 methylcobalamin:coenzyme M methyltransferase [Sedimentisphaera salicampi]